MNKRLLLFLPLFILSVSGFAQLQKGNKLLGGTINYSTSNNTPMDPIGLPGQASKTNSFTLSPIFGVFVTDRTVLGLRFNFNSLSNENVFSDGGVFNYESNQFGFGPFVRRYFPVKEWVAFYGQADLNYASGTIEQNYSASLNQGYKQSTKAFNLGASLGLAFFPTNWMSVDLAINPINFSHSVNENEGGSTISSENVNTFNVNLSSQSFNIGAHFFLNKK